MLSGLVIADAALKRKETAEHSKSDATRRFEKAEKVSGPLKKRLVSAEARLVKVGHENAAAILAGEAKVGEPCPVCHRPLGEHLAPVPGVAEKVVAAQDLVTDLREKCEAPAVSRAPPRRPSSNAAKAQETQPVLRRPRSWGSSHAGLQQQVKKAESDAEVAAKRVEKANEALDRARSTSRDRER